MSEYSSDTISDFLDAAVKDQPRAKQMFALHPQLKGARWLHEESLLHFLAVEYYNEAVRFLAGLGFDVNATNKFGDTALVDVVSMDNYELAELLLSLGANPNAESKTHDCVLGAAISTGNPKLIRLLLKAGAAPDRFQKNKFSLEISLPTDVSKRAAVLDVLSEYGVKCSPE